MGRIVKQRLIGIGIDPAGYCGHSLRAGFVTAAGEANLSALRISAYTAQSPGIVKRYFRRSEIWRNNPCGMIGL